MRKKTRQYFEGFNAKQDIEALHELNSLYENI